MDEWASLQPREPMQNREAKRPECFDQFNEQLQCIFSSLSWSKHSVKTANRSSSLNGHGHDFEVGSRSASARFNPPSPSPFDSQAKSLSRGEKELIRTGACILRSLALQFHVKSMLFSIFDDERMFVMVADLDSARSMSNSPQGAPHSGGPQSCPGHSLLPSKRLIPTPSTSCADDSYSNSIDSKAREGVTTMHHRAASESFLLEEQPSWLDDLLNEPETAVTRGTRRRSSSDSFAHLETSSFSWSADGVARESSKHCTSTAAPSWGSQKVDYFKDMQRTSYHMDANSFGGTQSLGSQFSNNTIAQPSGSPPSLKDELVLAGSSTATKKPHASSSSTTMDSRAGEGYSQDLIGSADRREGSQAKRGQSDMETKRAKQQFAQRSRVRKLQYIAELERHVQALQAEGVELSAQWQFLDQHNFILSLENKTLKQRLECLVHEHLVKCFQHDVLGQEASRLRALYQQYQQQQQPHRRSRSRDLDSQFAHLSLKNNESNSGPGQLQI
ncbi:hypothetical protein MUK42_16473 [Musa troglodytarum]|uniref:BZIP domain-containing protein n=1 Tax=Musa troglodytarum TaxID=320322 RepID=A0A9E7HSH3_9LILI|nr:hypothetical protein MUK42_16473 [Musa troglodytarum]